MGWRAQKEGQNTSDGFASVHDRLCFFLASFRAESALVNVELRECFVSHQMTCKGKAGEGKKGKEFRGAEEVVLDAS